MSTPTNDGGPAFPRRGQSVNFGDGWIPSQDGMSLRDYFAAKAMAALIAKVPLHDRDKVHGIPSTQQEVNRVVADICESSYWYADAMIAARNQTTK